MLKLIMVILATNAVMYQLTIVFFIRIYNVGYSSNEGYNNSALSNDYVRTLSTTHILLF